VLRSTSHTHDTGAFQRPEHDLQLISVDFERRCPLLCSSNRCSSDQLANLLANPAVRNIRINRLCEFNAIAVSYLLDAEE
jgi:hypothetical protein